MPNMPYKCGVIRLDAKRADSSGFKEHRSTIAITIISVKPFSIADRSKVEVLCFGKQ